MKTKQSFNVKNIFFAIVPPFDDQIKLKNKLLKYKVIVPSGNTSDYLFDIFDNASNDCKVEIMFKSDPMQNNPIRNELLNFVTAKESTDKEKSFIKLAKAMYSVTDERNGIGLFVLIEGKRNNETRLMLCRFKGSNALHTEGDNLKYLEQVFTKQNKHYKLAVFQDIVSSKSFWSGHAIDKQTSSVNYKPFSHFWIEDFLQSQTAITDKQGTSQFSKILKNVLNSTTDLRQKEQIISAAINLRSKTGIRISLKDFSNQYLSGKITDLLKNLTNNDSFYNTEFGVDQEELNKEFGNTVLMLEDGVTAYVPTFNYGKYVTESNPIKGEKIIKIEGVLKDKKVNTRRDVKEKTQNKKSN